MQKKYILSLQKCFLISYKTNSKLTQTFHKIYTRRYQKQYDNKCNVTNTITFRTQLLNKKKTKKSSKYKSKH